MLNTILVVVLVTGSLVISYYVGKVVAALELLAAIHSIKVETKKTINE